MSITARNCYVITVPEWSNGVALRATASASWVRIPPVISCSYSSVG